MEVMSFMLLWELGILLDNKEILLKIKWVLISKVKTKLLIKEQGRRFEYIEPTRFTEQISLRSKSDMLNVSQFVLNPISILQNQFLFFFFKLLEVPSQLTEIFIFKSCLNVFPLKNAHLKNIFRSF